MKISLKKVDDRAILPVYATKGSSGMDIFAMEDMTILAKERRLIRTGIAVEIPEGYELQVRPRSSLSLNTTLRIPNSPGTIDSDFRDEIRIIIENIDSFSQDYKIKRGQRIAQLVLQKVEKIEWELTDLTKTARTGGFGSTGE